MQFRTFQLSKCEEKSLLDFWTPLTSDLWRKLPFPTISSEKFPMVYHQIHHLLSFFLSLSLYLSFPCAMYFSWRTCVLHDSLFSSLPRCFTRVYFESRPLSFHDSNIPPSFSPFFVSIYLSFLLFSFLSFSLCLLPFSFSLSHFVFLFPSFSVR